MLLSRTTSTIVVLVVLLFPCIALAETLHVPADYATIQGCIDAAVSGADQCLVAPGTYNETINFLGKAVRLRSSHGADVTSIDATGIGGSVVSCTSGEGRDTILEGFTVTGGFGISSKLHEGFAGGGMDNYHSSPTVTDCVFRDNTAIDGGGMLNSSANPRVARCVFIDNYAFNRGAGMANYGDASPSLLECVFRGNRATFTAGECTTWQATPSSLAASSRAT